MERSIPDLVIKIEGLKDRASYVQDELVHIKGTLEEKDKRIDNLVADNNMLMELILRHGGHTDKCNYIEEMCSGRMLKDQEEDLCDCGWSETILMIRSRLGQ